MAERDDWLVSALASMARNAQVGIPVTVSVGGLLISGHLSSSAEYAKALTEMMFGGFERALGKKLENLQKEREMFATMAAKRDEPSDDEKPGPPPFIHLKDARIFHPGGKAIPKNGAIWWRVSVGAIDALTIGTLVEQSD